MWIAGLIATAIGGFALIYWLLWLFSREHMDAVLDRDYAHAEARRNRRLKALGLIADDEAPKDGV
jgi:hypothetical protein